MLKAAIVVANVPASATTKPSRGPCHPICHLPALVDNQAYDYLCVYRMSAIPARMLCLSYPVRRHGIALSDPDSM